MFVEPEPLSGWISAIKSGATKKVSETKVLVPWERI